MKIHNDVSRSVTTADKSTTTTKPSSTGAIRPASVGVDSVRISDASRALATGVSKTEAPFDAQRVEAIKAAIAAGQFKVDPAAVADKVIDSATQLLGA